MNLDPHTEDQLRLLCETRNRTVCEILDEATEPLHVEELADRLVARDVTVVRSSIYDDKFDQTYFELHHERLPKLDEVDLVAYDPETNLVSPSSSPASDVDWRDQTDFTELVTRLEAVHRDGEGDVGTIEGLDAAFEYARKLADEAEEELFSIYVTTDLLEEECLRHGENAIERGVAIYIGSQNATVRDQCREGLPEATIWEPQLDWLNAPTYPRVGRLILADRRKVMFSLLGEPPTDDGAPTEVALVGNGEDNPLVVLVRELLGPRLDHLDHQSDDFRTKLHS